MSKYTTELRFICEHDAGLVDSEGYNSINTILDNCVDKIFNFDFPIFDENYRLVLERKILKHYYTREIATETVGLWKHFLDMRLNEIMPYYNKLYESELLEFNPFYDVDLTKDHIGTGSHDTEHEQTDSETRNSTRTDDLTRTDNLTRTDDFTRTDNLSRADNITRTDNLLRSDDFTRTDNLKSTSQDSGTQGDSGSDVNKNTRWDVYSDTPQGALTNVDQNTYLTNARKIIDDGTGTTHTNTTTFGKKNVVDDTGTQRNAGTSANTGTQATNETETNTGTVRNAGTSANTGTQKNTGTQQNAGTTNATSESTTGIKTTDQYLEHVKGKTPGTSYSKLLQEYRDTFLNIDMQIINDLGDLFFGLW